MKYLVTANPGLTPIPIEQGSNILKSSKAWIEAKLGDGSIDVTYNYFGGGGFAIVNAESHEQVLGNILEYPMYAFFVWDVKPLLDFSDSIDQYTAFYDRLGS
jgi:hypothetical protein